MSLLIPTHNDYVDAHGALDEEQEFYRQFELVKDHKDEQGNYKYPWSFEVVEGFFKQADDNTDDAKFNYAVEDFGRLKSWSEIKQDLQKLNENAASNEQYKLIFFARHGQGYHNVIVEKYGIEEWHKHRRFQTTDGELTYAPDASLTPVGIKQAKENNEAWKRELSLGAPVPSKFFVSPLQRSSQTLVLTWNDLKPESLKPLITPLIRETMGESLCDKRSPVAVIKERFSKYGFVIPEDMPEDDIDFRNDLRETMPEQTFRVHSFLQGLFDEDIDSDNKVDKESAHANTFISTTSHAGTIRCFIVALKHRHFTISTGGMIPICIKGTRRVD
ncbi:histidine phosphatase superfamily [Scheffersomyces amazonensis]|uniref:histidine phosphatase superfamily n=1 Tax=Scheffersomyces amazonensis TaxID=1078765 RepID=UPI00315CEAD4